MAACVLGAHTQHAARVFEEHWHGLRSPAPLAAADALLPASPPEEDMLPPLLNVSSAELWGPSRVDGAAAARSVARCRVAAPNDDDEKDDALVRGAAESRDRGLLCAAHLAIAFVLAALPTKAEAAAAAQAGEGRNGIDPRSVAASSLSPIPCVS